MESVKASERRVHQRVTPVDGVFVLVNKKALPVLDISLGGLSFCADACTDSPFANQLEVLVMGNTIEYVDKIPHHIVGDAPLSAPTTGLGSRKRCGRRVSTRFSQLSSEQLAKLQYLFQMD